MYKTIKLETWKRKAIFDFYKDFDDPFFNLTGTIDVTSLYHFCKKNKLSFFLSNLYCAVETMNEIPEFKTRLMNDKVIEYEKISISSTVLHDDETFSFCYFERATEIFDFVRKGKECVKRQQRSKKLDPRLSQLDVVHCSVIPWVAFSCFKHAKKFGTNDSIPKIVFGKMIDENGRKKMSLSVEVNHALVDGFHVGKYFEKLQMRMNNLV